MKNSNTIIELSQVSLRFKKKELFSKLDLSIEKASLVSIAGRSGEGKSSLLYILGAFLKPTRGKYFFQENSVYALWPPWQTAGRFRRKNIGFLFQDFRLLPFLNVEQNISFPVLFSGQKITRKQIHKLMDDLSILHLRKSMPNQISGGEAQRTALGRALVLKPRVLLLDEPSGNLDDQTEQEILKIFANLKAQGLTLICVTHSRVIMSACDQVYELHEGKLKPKNMCLKENFCILPNEELPL